MTGWCSGIFVSESPGGTPPAAVTACSSLARTAVAADSKVPLPAVARVPAVLADPAVAASDAKPQPTKEIPDCGWSCSIGRTPPRGGT